MSWLDKISETVSTVGGYVRDIKVAEATGDGTAVLGTRAESVPDQSTVGVSDMAGPYTSTASASNQGLMSNPLVTVAVVIAAIAILPKLPRLMR